MKAETLGKEGGLEYKATDTITAQCSSSALAEVSWTLYQLERDCSEKQRDRIKRQADTDYGSRMVCLVGSSMK